MKYIYYELRKLAGMRYIWIFAAVLLTANFFLAIYSANQKSKSQIPLSTIKVFFAEYIDDPVCIETKYSDSIAFIADQNELLKRELYIHEYSAVIQNVINRACANVAEFDSSKISNTNYSYQYQVKVINLYENAQSQVKMVLEYSCGWDEYFTYETVNIFIFAVLLMFGSTIFAQEQNSGFIYVIHTLKNGKAKIAFAKIGAMLIITFLVIFIFTISTIAVFGAILGFSSTNNAIQIFSDFIFCPMVVTIGQYLLITIAFKLLVFFMFSCIILMISVFIYNYAIIYICGLFLFFINFLFYKLIYLYAEHPLKKLNLLAIAAVNPLFERYRSLNIFGYLIGYLPFIIFLCAIMIIVSFMIIVTIFNDNQIIFEFGGKNIFSFLIEKGKKSIVLIKEKIFLFMPNRQTFSLSIYFSEIYKTLISKRYILVVFAILIFKCYISIGKFTEIKSYSDDIYKEYMTTLEGDLTDEKLEYIIKERQRISDILTKKSEMFEKYFNEEIDFIDYRKYISEYDYAYLQNDVFAGIEQHLHYIERISEQKNIEAYFFYDTGWKKLFNNGCDIILYFLILFLFAGIFSDEYTNRSSLGNFIRILKSTKNGRERTFLSKFTSSLTISALLTFIFNAIDFILIFNNYDLPIINAPLISIPIFESIICKSTIIQYFVIYFLTRLFANLIFTVLVCGLSELFKNTVLVMGVCVAITMFPAFLSYFGLEIFKYFDFTFFLSATQLYLLSAKINLFGNAGFFVIFELCCILILCCILYKSEKDFVK